VKKIRAWSVIKVGPYRASSDQWTVDCVSGTRKGAIEKATRTTGEGWLKGVAAGLRAVRITIEVEE
jgi:hypothetical protein